MERSALKGRITDLCDEYATPVPYTRDGITVEITADHIEKKIRPALQFFDDTVDLDATVALEARVSLSACRAPDYAGGGGNGGDSMFPPIDGAFGIADVVFYDSSVTGRAGIIDWKFGDGYIVNADNNPQLKFYLCAAIQSGVLPVQNEYEAWIFQPAARLTPDMYASKGAYTLDELREFAADLADAINSSEYFTGPHCRWCKGKLSCAVFRNSMTVAVASDVRDMSSHEMSAALNMIPAITAWCRDMQSAALRNVQAGVVIPGWGTAPSLGNRTWKDPEAACGALGRLGMEITARTVRTVISAPKALAALAALGTPKEKVAKFERRHIIRPDNGERLVEVASAADEGSSLARLGALMTTED
jgi:hypothetical protein